MKKMKQTAAILLVLILAVFSLSACSSSNKAATRDSYRTESSGSAVYAPDEPAEDGYWSDYETEKTEASGGGSGRRFSGEWVRRPLTRFQPGRVSLCRAAAAGSLGFSEKPIALYKIPACLASGKFISDDAPPQKPGSGHPLQR